MREALSSCVLERWTTVGTTYEERHLGTPRCFDRMDPPLRLAPACLRIIETHTSTLLALVEISRGVHETAPPSSPILDAASSPQPTQRYRSINMAGRFVRSSKYRHVFGRPTRKVSTRSQPPYISLMKSRNNATTMSASLGMLGIRTC